MCQGSLALLRLLTLRESLTPQEIRLLLINLQASAPGRCGRLQKGGDDHAEIDRGTSHPTCHKAVDSVSHAEFNAFSTRDD